LDADGSASDRSRFFELVSGTATVSMYAAPTTYTLTAAVAASNSHTTARQEGPVLAAGDVETVALTILRLGNLKVAVVDADGNPVDAKVTLVDPDGIVASRSSDTQGGAVVFIAVRPQQWRVTATHTDGREGEATYTL